MTNKTIEEDNSWEIRNKIFLALKELLGDAIPETCTRLELILDIDDAPRINVCYYLDDVEFSDITVLKKLIVTDVE